MTTSTQRRGARLHNDPNKYVRRVKGGRWQARPHVPKGEDGAGRVNLGCFDTPEEARRAVLEFWWGKREPRYRWTRPVHRGDATRWIAVPRVPEYLAEAVSVRRRARDGRFAPGRVLAVRRAVRLPGEYATAREAHEAAKRWLRSLGLLGWWGSVAPAADLRTWPARAA